MTSHKKHFSSSFHFETKAKAHNRGKLDFFQMLLYLIRIDSNTKTDAALILLSLLIPLYFYLRKAHLPYSFKNLLNL